MKITIECDGEGDLIRLRDKLNRLFQEEGKPEETAPEAADVTGEIKNSQPVPQMLDEYFLFDDEIKRMKGDKK